MADLQTIIVSGFMERYITLAGAVTKLAAPLSEEEFWRKPFPFGNSFGHLVLHVTGNLNYYIGAEIGATGYLRDREREFTETNCPGKKECLKKFEEAVDVVLKSLMAQTIDDWEKEYTAIGETDAKNRMTIFLRCATHLHHHLGQMMYLGYAIKGEAAQEAASGASK
jgi:Protein of unknown function (DUF1572)